ncbi:MAG: glucose-inhibited division protein B [Nautilia sp.]|nr:MAG: glucose-inhibited division protein B [Nautilia sp.]
MLKLIILIVIGYIIYKIFFNKEITSTSHRNENENDNNELVECSNCHTFVPKNECKWTNNGCLCKECQ